MSNQNIDIRHAQPSDYSPIINQINDWWGGRSVADMLPKLFFVHFRDTTFVAESSGELVSFLIGFLSQTFPDEAYIHFVGVHPEFRKAGISRQLYKRFFTAVHECGRTTVRCITSPINKSSIAFHLKMGFEIEPQDKIIEGVPVYPNYDGRNGDRVLFVKTWT